MGPSVEVFTQPQPKSHTHIYTRCVSVKDNSIIWEQFQMRVQTKSLEIINYFITIFLIIFFTHDENSLSKELFLVIL